MPEVKDIHPLWPVRPVGPRPSPGRDERRVPPRGETGPGRDDAGDDEEDPRHVDEYA